MDIFKLALLHGFVPMIRFFLDSLPYIVKAHSCDCFLGLLIDFLDHLGVGYPLDREVSDYTFY